MSVFTHLGQTLRMPAAVRPLPHAAGDTGNLLDREMCPPEPQQTRITIGAWQGLEQRRIYARKDFARNGKSILIEDPSAWKNLL